jgi:hypothetical protein
MHIAFLMFGMLLLASQLGAQVAGDSVRVRRQAGAEWVVGRVAHADSVTFTLRSGLVDNEYRFSDVARVERWKRDKLVMRVVTGAAASVVGWQLGRELAHDGDPATGSRGGDIALTAVIGTVFSLISYAIAPGSWRRVRSSQNPPR